MLRLGEGKRIWGVGSKRHSLETGSSPARQEII